MIKFPRLLVLLVVISINCLGQQLTVTPQVLFGSVTEVTADSMQITITNSTGKSINISGYRFYNTYGNPAFSTSVGGFTLANGNSQNIWVRFLPIHNIYHNSELIILNDGACGPLRVDLRGQGHYTKTYYNLSENLEEEALKLQLQTITGNNYNSLGYSTGARDYMFMTLDNQALNGQGASANTIECVYTGRQIVGYTSRVQCQDQTDPYYNFNTEHTYPQSLFSSNEPMKSDLFHLYPSDETANGKRASLPFGMVNNPSWSVGGSKLGVGVFEPRDAHKGEVARAMLYFVMRYQNYGNFIDSQESILKQWNHQFPPTIVETTRCNLIYTQQQNRNPFIDYPQLVDRITSFSTTSVAQPNYSLDIVENAINFGSISTNTNYNYQFIIVNNGNQPINFTSFSLSSAQLIFTSPFAGNDTIIQPGESLPVLIKLNVNQIGAVAETLQFNTDDPSNGSVIISILANAITSGIVEMKRDVPFSVYPNPFTNKVCIDPSPSSKAVIRLFDLQGRIITSKEEKINSCFEFENTLPSGTYIMEIKDGDLISRKILISN